MEHNLPFILKEVINVVSECTRKSQGLTVKGIIERVKSSLKYPDKLNKFIHQGNVVKALNEGMKCGIIGKRRGKFVLGPKSNDYKSRKRGDGLIRKHCPRCKRSRKRHSKRKRGKAKKRRRYRRPESTTSSASCVSPASVSSEGTVKDDKKSKKRKRSNSRSRSKQKSDTSEDSENLSSQSGNSTSSSQSSRNSDNKRRKKDDNKKKDCDSSSEQSPEDGYNDSHSKEIIYIKKPK